MKKVSIFSVIVLVIFSCSSLKILNKDDLSEYSKVKRFNFSDFKTYAFNICEKYANSVESSERFCECPDDFFDVAQRDKIRKVEELYLLIHRKTDLVLYFTTTSHKYIYKEANGFLNDSVKYKNNIVLNEIENIYIGRKDTVAGFIHFPSFKDVNDIILHFDKEKYSENILFTKANIATAENDYDISEEIPLDSIFNQDLVYKYKKNMILKYYRKGKNSREKEVAMDLDRIAIASKKGRVKTLYGFTNTKGLYKYTKIKVKYHPNFSLIQIH